MTAPVGAEAFASSDGVGGDADLLRKPKDSGKKPDVAAEHLRRGRAEPQQPNRNPTQR
ncbi:hypothetical protein [Streptomyces sp. NPDC053755]|uniref:hypothetical protein n=1 Tax=Streptomyces sp. NPDC053755 TaxID=3155815 RepID=UPI00341B09FA